MEQIDIEKIRVNKVGSRIRAKCGQVFHNDKPNNRLELSSDGECECKGSYCVELPNNTQIYVCHHHKNDVLSKFGKTIK